jgi:CheY-like chemotaxis protein
MAPPDAAGPARPRILIADDNPDILQTTSVLLDHFGYETIPINSAEKILPAISRVHPDLVLQDVYMPDLDLPAMLRTLRADPAIARTPVLLFTASVEGDEIAPQVGADGLVHKPFDLRQLRSTIDGFVRRTADHTT